MIFWGEGRYNSYFCSSRSNVKNIFFWLLSWFIKKSLFLLFLCSLNMICLGMVFGVFILLGYLFCLEALSWASWICGLLSIINLGEILSNYYFKYFFYSCLSLLLLVFPLSICFSFLVAPLFLDSLFCFFPPDYFLFAFQFWKFLWTYPQAQRFSSQALICQSTNIPVY